MFPNSHTARHPAQTLSLCGQFVPSPYDFTSYHQYPGVGDPTTTTSAWNPVYAPREEFPYGFPGSSPNAGQVSFASPELSGTPTPAAGASFPSYNWASGQDAFCPSKRHHEPIKPSVSGGKTRTKDKYRVVYTDHQRQELENEFQCNRYITIRRKTELSMELSLSERQVKIWFQNRRAKERKINRKKLQHCQQPSTSTPALLAASTDALNATSDAISDEY